MRMTLIVLAFLALGLCGCEAYQRAFDADPVGVAATEDAAIATATGVAALLPVPLNAIALGAVGALGGWLVGKRTTRTPATTTPPAP